MTISANEAFRSGPYNGNGSTTVFDYEFTVFQPDDLVLTRRNVDGTQSVLARAVDYTVQGVAVTGGGTVTLVDGDRLPTGTTLVITSDITSSQDRPFSSQSSLSLEEVELGLDKLTALVRKLEERAGRAISAPVDSAASAQLVARPVPNTSIVFGPTGDVATGPSVAQIADANAQGPIAVEAAKQSIAAANRAEVARDDAQGVLPDRLRRDVPTLLADTTLTNTPGQPGSGVPGDIVRTQSDASAFRWEPEDATGPNVITTTGGPDGPVKLLQTAGRILSELTFKVPTDFPDIVTAIEKLSPLYSAGAGLRALIILESGYQITAPITIARGFYAHIRIQSEDATVPVTAALGGVQIITFLDCFAPAFDFLIDAQGNSDGLRYRLCRGEIMNGAGCINAVSRGIEVTHSHLIANLSVFDGAASVGIRVSNSSIANFRGALARNCGIGATVTGDSCANFNPQGTPTDFSGATLDGLNASLGLVEAQGLVAENCGRAGIYVERGSRVQARDAILRNAGEFGIYAASGALVQGENIDASGAGVHGIWANEGEVSAFGANVSGAGTNAIRSTAGRVGVRNGNLQNAGADACFAEDGGFINARGSNTAGVIGVAFKVDVGGKINARSAAGSLSQEPNVETRNGIIYSDLVATVQDWVPTFVPASGAFGSITYGAQVGKIQRISDKVYLCSYEISTSEVVLGTASGNLRIAGPSLLPAGGNQTSVTVRNVRRFATSWPNLCGEYISNQMRLYVNASNSFNLVEAQVADLDTGSGIRNMLSGSFIVTIA